MITVPRKQVIFEGIKNAKTVEISTVFAIGGSSGTRTLGTLIKSQVLYQLS